MKLFGIAATCVVGGYGAGLGTLTSTITREFQSYQRIQSSTKVDSAYLTELDGYAAQDIKAHGNSIGVRGIQLMPDGGQCGLHWDLCPNMCNLEDTLENKFSEIIGNKMEKYQEWKAEVETKKRAITEDLVGKLDQVEGLEDELARNGLDLEKRQDLFLSLIEGHLERANQIKDSLIGLKDDFDDIGDDLNALSQKVTEAHDDCYEQAPCMAVPKCKLGVASGESCAEIAENAMDLDDQGEPTLNLESTVHIIQPRGLEAKAAICEFDYTGTGFTVVQNRHNNTGSFTGDFENGFGTTVGYDDAECAVANYYLGNKYIKKLVKADSSLKVKHHDTSVEQWNGVKVRGNSYQLSNGGHVCGDNTMADSQVKMNAGGVNGGWTGQSQIMIGKDKSPDMDTDCLDDVDYSDVYEGGNGGSSYGSKGSDSSSY